MHGFFSKLIQQSIVFIHGEMKGKKKEIIFLCFTIEDLTV